MTTIKSLTLIITCCCCFSLQAQKVSTQITYSVTEAGDNHIAYIPSQKLSISDFEGAPVVGSSAVAITSSGFAFKAGFRRKGNTASLNVIVYCSFNRGSSWMKENGKNGYVLQHEQHHFDISYLGALDFMERIKQIKFTVKNYNEKLNEAYQAAVNKMEALQHAYDGQTQNGIAKDEQLKWNQKIENELRLVTSR